MSQSDATTEPILVAAVQSDPKLGDPALNLAAILGRLAEAAKAGARLVVFPECTLTGYCFDSREEAMAVAEPIPGPSTEAIGRACRELGTTAVYGLIERDGDKLYNACEVVGPEGLIGSYRKVHLPFMGVDRFADPGEHPFRVIEAAGLRLGVHICYDGTFPEAGRVLALDGADLLVLPTNFPAGAENVAEHVMACRAIENTVYALTSNRVGEERGVRFVGRSAIHGPAGETLAKAGPAEETLLVAQVDPRRAQNKKIVRVPGKMEIDRIADRRPAFYGRLVENNPS